MPARPPGRRRPDLRWNRALRAAFDFKPGRGLREDGRAGRCEDFRSVPP